jgi:hypothetical protein
MFVIFSFLIGMGAIFFMCTDSDLAHLAATLNVRVVHRIKHRSWSLTGWKLKFSLLTPRTHREGVEVYLRFFLTSALDGGGWSNSPWAKCTPGQEPQWRTLEPVWKILYKRRSRTLLRFELFKIVLPNKMKHLSLLYVWLYRPYFLLNPWSLEVSFSTPQMNFLCMSLRR